MRTQALRSLALMLAACSLNPQPLPPDQPGDASATLGTPTRKADAGTESSGSFDDGSGAGGAAPDGGELDGESEDGGPDEDAGDAGSLEDARAHDGGDDAPHDHHDAEPDARDGGS